MKRLALLLLFALLFASHSQVSAQGRKEQMSLLWEISGNGLATPSYLYGTMHLYDRRAFDFSDSVLLKFRQCTAFAAELDMGSAFRDLVHYYLEQEGIRVANMMVDTVSTASIPLSASEQDGEGEIVEPVQPKAPSGVVMKKQQSAPVQGPARARTLPEIFFNRDDSWKPGDKSVMLDAYLYRLAKKEQKKIIGLEMAREQLQALAHGSSMETGVFNFLNARRLRRLSKENLREMMIGWYHQGNLDKLQEFMQQNVPPTLYRHMIVERNKNMVARAEQHIRREPTFIAVGAGHLGGTDGMIKLFRAQGYTVRPVRNVRTGLAKRYREPEYREEWYTYSSPSGAYSVAMPSEPVTMAEFHKAFNQAPNQLDSGLRFVFDAPSGIAYKAGYFDYSFEMALPDKDGGALLPPVLARIYRDSMKLPPIPLVMNGMQGREMRMVTQEGRVRRTRMFVRGNRVYMLQAETVPDLEKSEDIERFFASFETRGFAGISMRPYTSREAGFTTLMPAAPSVRTDTLFYLFDRIDRTYLAPDPNSGDFFSVELRTFSEHFRAENEEKLFDDAIQSSPVPGDSLTRMVSITVQGFPGLDVESFNPRSGFSRRTRFILNGNRLYILRLSASRDRIFSASQNAFLDSFRLDGNRITADIYSDKNGKILEDLSSEYSATRARAQRALLDHNHKVSPQYLPALYALLGKSVRAHDSASSAMAMTILDKLARMRDSSATDAIRAIYPELPKKAFALRNAALSALAVVGTEESVTLFKKLLLEHPALSISEAPPFAEFYDNIKPVRYLYPDILRLLEYHDYRYDLYSLTSAALDDSTITGNDIAPYAPIITEQLRSLQLCRATPTVCTDDEFVDADIMINQVAACAARLPASPELQEVLTRLLNDSTRDLASHAALGLIRQGRPVAPKMLNWLAADPAIRLRMYRGLRELDKLELLPVAYLTQKSIAESYMVDWLAHDDHYAPDSIRFLAEREVEVKGIRGRAFLFKFKYDNWDGRWRVGIGGLQPLEQKDLAFATDITWSDYRMLEKQSTDDLFVELLRTIEGLEK